MTRLTASVALVIGMLTFSSSAAMAQEAQPLPSPLSLSDVIQIASERRDEIQAARARTTAGEARPIIVSALSDPMISPSLDHLPFMMNGADVSVTIEQQIPLSGIRSHRRASALADLDRLRAEASRTTLDVGVEAANAYLMLQERRRTAALVNEQIAFARDVVSAANARYASGTAPQSDVLRAEVETVLGLLPLLWEAGVGADVSARTAAPVVGGLWSCMFLTLLVLPAAYAMWRRHQVRATLTVSLPHDAATSEGAV